MDAEQGVRCEMCVGHLLTRKDFINQNHTLICARSQGNQKLLERFTCGLPNVGTHALGTIVTAHSISQYPCDMTVIGASQTVDRSSKAIAGSLCRLNHWV